MEGFNLKRNTNYSLVFEKRNANVLRARQNISFFAGLSTKYPGIESKRGGGWSNLLWKKPHCFSMVNHVLGLRMTQGFYQNKNHREPAFHSKARNAQLTKVWLALKYTILLFFVTQIKSIPQFIHCILMKRSTFIRKPNCLLYCLNR